MKKLVLTLLAFVTLTFAGFSQEGRKPGRGQMGTPTEMAEKEAGRATKKLVLTENQRTQFKQFALERINANKPLREKLKATTDATAKQNIEKEIKANRDIFYNKVKDVLTPEQQVKWAEARKNMEEKKATDHK